MSNKFQVRKLISVDRYALFATFMPPRILSRMPSRTSMRGNRMEGPNGFPISRLMCARPGR